MHDGDWKTLRNLWDSGNPQGKGEDNGYAMYLATQCTDMPWPAKWAKWKKDNAAVHAKAPFMTWSNAWYNAPCRFWDGEVAKAAPKVDGAKAPAILLISETLDPATPYPGALEARARFPKSVLIEHRRHHPLGFAEWRRLHRRRDRGLPEGRHAAGPGERPDLGQAVRPGTPAGLHDLSPR